MREAIEEKAEAARKEARQTIPEPDRLARQLTRISAWEVEMLEKTALDRNPLRLQRVFANVRLIVAISGRIQPDCPNQLDLRGSRFNLSLQL